MVNQQLSNGRQTGILQLRCDDKAGQGHSNLQCGNYREKQQMRYTNFSKEEENISIQCHLDLINKIVQPILFYA